MADNVGYTPGSGATIAADDIAGILHQRVKLSLGADGTAADCPGDGTNGMDVDVTRMPTSATATTTTVADNASSTTVLASNSSRKGASVTNDSSAALYLLVGSGTASTTNYTVRIAQYGYFEVPYGYTGQLTGIWDSDPGDGAARVTEYT